MSKRGKIPHNKWEKTKVMVKHQQLTGHIPETLMLSRDSVKKMLSKHGMVYIKPRVGWEGRGVARIAKKLRGRRTTYRCQSGERVQVFPDAKGMHGWIRKLAGKEPYLVQQGIRMLKYDGRPFDIRLMVQRNPKKDWEVTGYVARVAHPQKIVTNGSQGGTIYPVRHVLTPHASKSKIKKTLRKMKRISLISIRQLHSVYPKLRELGLDIAIDRKLRPWILEANSKPDPCPFKKVRDQSMLRKIVKYGKAFGRSYNLTCARAKSGKV